MLCRRKFTNKNFLTRYCRMVSSSCGSQNEYFLFSFSRQGCASIQPIGCHFLHGFTSCHYSRGMLNLISRPIKSRLPILAQKFSLPLTHFRSCSANCLTKVRKWFCSMKFARIAFLTPRILFY